MRVPEIQDLGHAHALLEPRSGPSGLPEISRSMRRLRSASPPTPGGWGPLRARLAAQRHACPLFDSERYRRGLGAAYTLMWQRAENHRPPIPFTAPDRPMAGA